MKFIKNILEKFQGRDTEEEDDMDFVDHSYDDEDGDYGGEDGQYEDTHGGRLDSSLQDKLSNSIGNIDFGFNLSEVTAQPPIDGNYHEDNGMAEPTGGYDEYEEYEEDYEEEVVVYVDEYGNEIDPSEIGEYEVYEEEEEEDEDTYEESTYTEEEYTEQPYRGYTQDPQPPSEITLSGVSSYEDDDYTTDFGNDDYREVTDLSVEEGVGLLDTHKKAENNYEDMLYSITEEDKNSILTIIDKSDNIYEMLDTMTAEGIPLQYLVAMDVMSIEEIHRYQKYKELGITAEPAKADDLASDDYLVELLKQRNVNVPEEIATEESESGSDITVGTPDVMLGTETQDLSAEEVPRTDQESEYVQEEETAREEEQGEVTDQEEETTAGNPLSRLKNLQSLLGGMTAGAENALPETEGIVPDTPSITDPVESEHVEQEEIVPVIKLPENKQRDALERSKKKLSKHEQKQGTHVNKKEIYVVCDGIDMGDKLGEYYLHEVKELNDLSRVELNSDATVLLTNIVPSTYKKQLVEWLSTKNKGDIRVVTLNGYEYDHEMVQTAIDFDEDSLNSYYKEEKYKVTKDKTKTGSHIDLTNLLM